MEKLDRLLLKAKVKREIEMPVRFDFSEMSTDELKEFYKGRENGSLTPEREYELSSLIRVSEGGEEWINLTKC